MKILGAHGSVSQTGRTTSFLITPAIAIDAGNLITPLGEASADIEHLFITHTHSDHIVDLPFLMTSYIEKRTKTLKIYGLQETIETLKAHLFNWKIWPDFSTILLHNGLPRLEYITINLNQPVVIGETHLLPIYAQHSIPTCGFKVTTPRQSVLISGDTFVNMDLIARLNREKEIESFIVDVSFESRHDDIAVKSQHLTPKLLAQMLEKLDREDIRIYTYHQKPLQESGIEAELEAMGVFRYGGRCLRDGEEF